VRVLEGPWQGWEPPDGPKSLTIGVLDGVHIGHRSLLATLRPTMIRTVLTFDPHPLEVLRPGTHPRLLTTLPERVTLLGVAGVECVGVLDLAAIKELAPETFVTDVLVSTLQVGHVVVGEDFRFGKDRSGDVTLLTALGAEMSFEVETIPILDRGGEAVSSSRIRHLIEQGDVGEAAQLLGSRFTVRGTVVDGDKRGRAIGFPTANLRPPAQKVIPASGVYAGMAVVAGESHQAAINVGVRPTFGGGELLVEAFILDFEDDLYGKEIAIEFVERLRPELAFDDVSQLVEAMHEDVARARSILGRAGARM
jgi:riboflavin kinase / FMN adenylyltransferase